MQVVPLNQSVKHEHVVFKQIVVYNLSKRSAMASAAAVRRVATAAAAAASTAGSGGARRLLNIAGLQLLNRDCTSVQDRYNVKSKA